MVRFNGQRLGVMRRFHDLTQRELGERTGSAASAINAYEHGQREPKGLALDALCAALGVASDFFLDSRRDDEFHEHETNFRSLTSTPDRLRRKVLAHATLFGVLLDYLGKVVHFPSANLPTVRASTIEELERAAEQCREAWGVGADAPIQSVTQMIELAGVVVTMLDGEIGKQIDAFSRYGTTNLVVLNPAKGSATRLRMDVAHEAAHAALHRNGLPLDLSVKEEQADNFAGALLLPQRAFAREFWALGRTRSWESLFSLKERWGVSVPAIVVRAYRLGMMDAAEYRRRFKYMNREGWLRGMEPFEPEGEKPRLFSLILDRFQSETGQDASAIADALHWSPSLFRQISGMELQPSPADPQIASFEDYRQRKMASS